MFPPRSFCRQMWRRLNRVADSVVLSPDVHTLTLCICLTLSLHNFQRGFGTHTPPPPSTTRELDIGSDACVQFLTHVRTIRRVLISHGRGGGRGLLPESLCRGLKSVFFSPSESYQPHITAGLLLFLQKAWLKCKALKQLVPLRSSSFCHLTFVSDLILS